MTVAVPGAAVNLPPRIALVGLDDELARYFCAWIATHWPEARVRYARAGDHYVADLVIVDREPKLPTRWPTLWLADVDRSSSVIQLAPDLWRTAMPTTARRLQRAIEACLDRLRA